jgi:hypothetical protein
MRSGIAGGLATAALSALLVLLSPGIWPGGVAARDGDGGSASEPGSVESFVEGADVLRDLREVVGTLETERRAHHASHRAKLARLGEAKRTADRLAAEVADLRSEDDELDKQLAELQRELESLRARQAAAAPAARALGELLASAEVWARGFVGSGPPFRREQRLARLAGESASSPRDPGDGVADDALDLANSSERLRRLWEFAQTELALARSSEAFTAEVPLPGGVRIHARLFRVGHVFLGYVEENGDRTGLWLSGASAGWQHETSAAEGDAARTAVAILDRDEIRRLVPLPVTLVGGQEDSRGDADEGTPNRGTPEAPGSEERDDGSDR